VYNVKTQFAGHRHVFARLADSLCWSYSIEMNLKHM